GTPAFPIDDPSGVALDGFYAALARSDDSGRSQAITRVAHFGDSSIGQDGLPHELRRRFQDRFGDAGGGFVLLHKSSSNYLNRVVETRSNELWKVCYIAYGCRSDGRYGYGGHLFSGARGAVAKFSTTPPGNLGDKALRFELWYQAWPQGGRVELLVDGESAVTLDTRRATKQDLWHTLDVPLGAHSFEVHTRGPGDFRGYGAVLESEGPGVVWDSMSMNGAFTKRLLFFADAHIAGQIAHRNPDLIVLNYGGNDLRRFVNRNVYPDRFREEMMAAIERIRSGKPEASCLVMGVIDHGRSGTYPVEPEHVALLVEIQREVALTQGCAFFDSYEAMGGEGSIRRWRKLRPSLASADLKHLNARGRKRMAGYIYEGLLHGYATYRRRVNDSP
ncbi:MAG: GDSL-type esterase/lipase family protein, partial [Nannocystaceae bacterium]